MLTQLKKSARAIQKTAEATRDLAGNKIAEKITSSSKKLHNKEIQSNESNTKREIDY